jgi:hypothetical protein
MRIRGTEHRVNSRERDRNVHWSIPSGGKRARADGKGGWKAETGKNAIASR